MTNFEKDINEAFDRFESGSIDEMNTTGNIDGGEGPPKTPHAFAGSEDNMNNDHIEVLGYTKVPTKSKKYFVSESDSLFKRMANQIHEVSYQEFKKDPAMTSKQKINQSIKEISSRLFQIERFFKQNQRLKEEDSLDRSQYWKSTAHKICKIHERIKSLEGILETFGVHDIIKENETRQKMIDFIVACNTELKPKDHWKEEHLKGLSDDKLKILVRNRIRSVPGLAKTYNAGKLL